MTACVECLESDRSAAHELLVAALFEVKDPREAGVYDPVCMGHALTQECDGCGHLIGFCHLWGCGRWQPISGAVSALVQQVHEVSTVNPREN